MASKRSSASEPETDAKKISCEAEKTYIVNEWIEENKKFFLPPVCNKLMYGGQLKVMFIGGPNIRKDYHMEEGEEWFYQLKGDMVLKVVEKGKHKDVVIKEGECFMLPSRIPHSPQRFENTVGLVIERDRMKTETDGLRYFVDGTTDTLWEEWFYCYDLGTQLGPVIKKFFASEEYKKGKPPEGKVFDPPPFELDTERELHAPFNFKQLIMDNKSVIEEKGNLSIFDKGEFKVVVWGNGTQEEECYDGEVFLWQLEGQSELVREDDTTSVLKEDECLLMQPNEKFTAKCVDNDGRRVSVKTDPFANKPGYDPNNITKTGQEEK